MSESPSIEAGLAGEATTIVSPENTAQAMGSGQVPVYATPALLALLEEAAVRAIAGTLATGQTSVGVRVDLHHLAATPIGMTVSAQAMLTAVEGRRLLFNVSAHDGVEQVARGTHERVIVNESRFLERAVAKTPGHGS